MEKNKISRPRVFFDIAINDSKSKNRIKEIINEKNIVGRIVIELFADKCPKTCENFRILSIGKKEKKIKINREL